MEGLAYGGKSIGLACSGEETYHFCFVFTLYLRANSKYKPPPPVCLYLEWRFNGGFFALRFRGLFWRGLFSEFYGNPFVQWLVGTKHFPDSKICPKFQKQFLESKKCPRIKTHPRIQKHPPESKNSSQKRNSRT